MLGLQVYDQALEEALLHLWLDARGVAASAGWDIDGALLRVRLRHLRGICTHPQVCMLLSFCLLIWDSGRSLGR